MLNLASGARGQFLCCWLKSKSSASEAISFFLSLHFSTPPPKRDDMEAIPGYLSLHQTADIMTLKWTPNQLMNGSVGDLDYEKR